VSKRTVEFKLEVSDPDLLPGFPEGKVYRVLTLDVAAEDLADPKFAEFLSRMILPSTVHCWAEMLAAGDLESWVSAKKQRGC
jgi:hypothetical protein